MIEGFLGIESFPIGLANQMLGGSKSYHIQIENQAESFMATEGQLLEAWMLKALKALALLIQILKLLAIILKLILDWKV
jgi:hypothetical protein